MRLAEKDRPSPPTTSSSRVSFISQTTTTTTTTPAAQQDSPHSCPPWVQLETNLGTLLLELYWKHAPKTCYNFAQLAQRQYYDDVVFHRIVHDFIVQGGDPTGTGRGGTSIYGDVFEDEITDELRHTGAGILSMANAGPNTNASQFFLTLAPTPNLDGKHTIFGRVKRGIHVLKRIGNVETDSYDRSLQTVKILKAYPVEH